VVEQAVLLGYELLDVACDSAVVHAGSIRLPKVCPAAARVCKVRGR
jgi:hypothetical protein